MAQKQSKVCAIVSRAHSPPGRSCGSEKLTEDCMQSYESPAFLLLTLEGCVSWLGQIVGGIFTEMIRVAAVGDVHAKKASAGVIRPLFAGIQKQADVLALCGDLTDSGLPEEMEVLVKELADIKIPICAVLGNHDFDTTR